MKPPHQAAPPAPLPRPLPAPLHPPRVADQPVKVLGYTIPPGTLLWPNVYLMHTAPHNWEDAKEFRWGQRAVG